MLTMREDTPPDYYRPLSAGRHLLYKASILLVLELPSVNLNCHA